MCFFIVSIFLVAQKYFLYNQGINRNAVTAKVDRVRRHFLFMLFYTQARSYPVNTWSVPIRAPNSINTRGRYGIY